MAPTSLLKVIPQCKHPNSRKTKALAKKTKRFNNRGKIKLGHAIKSNILGEKFVWFTERVDSERALPLSQIEFDELIELYLQRFNVELQQIALKQSISKNRSQQHASRLDILKMTIERERAAYDGGGLELMNLCDEEQYRQFRLWDGNAVNLQHFKMERISKKSLLKNSNKEGI